MDRSASKITTTLIAVALAGALGCSGAQQGEGGSTAAEVEPSESGGDDDPAADEGSESAEAEDRPPACVALDNDEVDPLHRWFGVFPIGRGGAVMTFVGPEAQQMDVEASLEIAGFAGYEDLTCGTAVIVWVPGVECHGQQQELSGQIEEISTMSYSEADSSCFRIDEVRQRIREECERGTLPAVHCD